MKEKETSTNIQLIVFKILPDFSLEKTKATKDEKKARQQHMNIQGGEIIHRGPEWTVVKIEDQGELGRDALVSTVEI